MLLPKIQQLKQLFVYIFSARIVKCGVCCRHRLRPVSMLHFFVAERRKEKEILDVGIY